VLLGFEIFALPSSGEGFGLVYLEAMARGQAGDWRRARRRSGVIDDGKTGYLVQHGDVPQLATSIETLLADPALAGRNGRARARAAQSRFQIQRVCQIAEEDSARIMRILNVTQTYAPFLEFGGPPVKVRALSETLARRGHQITVLTADWGFETGLAMRSNPAARIAHVRLAMRAKWSAGDLSADVVSVSRAELESGGEPIFAGAAAEFRRGAYFSGCTIFWDPQWLRNAGGSAFPTLWSRSVGSCQL